MSAEEERIKIAILEERIVGLERAITLQAKEYERRLQELNHAHQQQVDRNAHYVSRESWDLRNMEVDKWRRQIDQWRWISIGAGLAGGGVSALIMRLLS